MIFLVAAGAGATLVENPLAMRVIRILGVLVLLWLAWKIATAGRGGSVERERPVGFYEAAAFQWVNPKAWLACASAVGTFLQGEGSSAVAQAALFAGLFIVTGTPCMTVWLGFGAAMQRLLRSDRALRGFNVAMGLLLAATVFVVV
jgi:threonine/homoserine/homoserine lactone efflux protein